MSDHEIILWAPATGFSNYNKSGESSYRYIDIDVQHLSLQRLIKFINDWLVNRSILNWCKYKLGSEFSFNIRLKYEIAVLFNRFFELT